LISDDQEDELPRKPGQQLPIGSPVVAIADCSIFTLEQVVTHCKYLKATAAEVGWRLKQTT
jgi:hypothetical protein